jgi:hypothetical protein
MKVFQLFLILFLIGCGPSAKDTGGYNIVIQNDSLTSPVHIVKDSVLNNSTIVKEQIDSSAIQWQKDSLEAARQKYYGC